MYKSILKNSLELRFVELHNELGILLKELHQIDISKPLTGKQFTVMRDTARAEGAYTQVKVILSVLGEYEIDDTI